MARFEFLGRFARNRGALLGAGLILLVALTAVLAPLFYPTDPLRIVGAPELWPGEDPDFPLGTDSLGRDILAMIVHGARATLLIGLFYAAVYARVMRSSMLEVAQLDFVRTARAKGLSRNKVTISHVLRNALLPVVTILGVQMGTVLAGSVVIESVFSWPGVGSLLFDSVSSRNYPVVLGIMVLGSLVVIVANIAVDLIYMWLDPRIEIR